MLGIIGAMPEEIEFVKQEMTNASEKNIGGVLYYFGTIGKQKIVLCKSGIGKVNSAFAATILINVLGAEAVIFTGVAGGIHPELELGDLVIGTDFLYHDFDARALGYQISEIPDNSQSLFFSDEKISATITKIAEQAFGSNKVRRGRIISGDQFIASYDKIKEFQTDFDAYAVDMESASVAHIANKNNIPCCIIRAVSDKADGQASETYTGFFTEAAKHSAYLVVEFAKIYS